MALTYEDLIGPTKPVPVDAKDYFNDLAKEVTLQKVLVQITRQNQELKKEYQNSQKNNKSDDARFKEIEKAANDLVKKFSSIQNDDKKSDAVFQKGINNLATILQKALPNKGKNLLGNIPSQEASVLVTPDKASTVAYGNEFTSALKQATSAAVGTFLSGILGGADAYRLLTKGMIDEQYEYASEMNKIAFRTRGITDASRDLQSSFRATSDGVRETGFDISHLQSQMLKASRRGVVDSQKIAKAGLGLGKMIGVSEQEAASLSDTFFDWNQKIGLTGTQLGSLAHEIKEVSRYTGVVSTNLAESVRSSERYLDKMRSANNLTASAAANIIALQTSAKKLGYDDNMSEFLNGLTSRNNFVNSSKENISFTAQAASKGGVLDELNAGSMAQSTESLKSLNEGIKRNFKDFANIDLNEVYKLSAEERAVLDQRLQSAYKLGIGDIQRQVEVLEESSKSYSDKMSEINQELAEAVNSEERLTAERKKQDLFMTKSMSYTSQLAEASKNASSFDDALIKIQNSMTTKQFQDYTTELASVAGTYSEDLKQQVLTGNKDAMTQALAVSSAQALKQAGGQDFTARIMKAVKNNDVKQFSRLQEKMAKEQQKLGITDSTIGDPIERATDQIKILNENIVKYSSAAVMWAAQTAGSTSIMALLLGTIAAQGYFGVEALRSWADVLFKGINMFGTGAAGTTAGAAATGAINSPWIAAAGTTAAATTTAGTAATTGATVATAESATLAGAGSVARISLLGVAKVLGTIGAIAGALVGHVQAGEEAINHFGVELEDLTTSQLYASKGAGLLTGALNFLTFGLFNNFLGPSGSLTIMLAKFNQVIPVLSLVSAVLDVVTGAIYGTYKLIVNIFSGFFGMIAKIASPFVMVAKTIIEVISDIISPFTNFGNKVSETGTLFENVSSILGGIGNVIGGIFEGIGSVVNFVLTPFAKLASWLLKLAGAIRSGLLSPLVMLFNGVKNFVSGLVEITSGLLTLNFTKVYDGIKNIGFGIIQSISAFIFEIPIMVFNVIKNIIPFILDLGSVILGVFKKLIIDIPKALITLPYQIITSIIDGFKSLASNELFGDIFKPFLEIFEPIGEGVNALKNAFFEFTNAFKPLLSIFDPLFKMFSGASKTISESISLMGIFTSVIKSFSFVVGNIIRVVLLPLTLTFQTLGGLLKMAAWGINLLSEGVKLLVNLVKKTVDAIISPFTYLYDVLVGHSIIPDLVTEIVFYFAKLPIKIMSSLFSMLPNMLGFFTNTVGDFVSSTITNIISGFSSSGIVSMITDQFVKAKDAASSFFSGIFNKINSSGLIEKGKTIISSAGSKIVKGITLGKELLTKLFGKGDGISELIKGNFVGALKEFKNGMLSLIPEFKFVWDFFENNIISGFKWMGSKISDAGSWIWESISEIGTSIWNGFKSYFGWILGDDMEAKAAERGNNIASGVSPVYKASVAAEQNIASPANTQIAQTASLVSVHDKVKREKAGTSKDQAVSTLGELVFLQSDILHYAIVTSEGIKQLVELLQGGGSSSGNTSDINPRSTRSNNKPVNSTNYHKWQFAGYDSNASQAVVSDGR